MADDLAGLVDVGRAGEVGDEAGLERRAPQHRPRRARGLHARVADDPAGVVDRARERALAERVRSSWSLRPSSGSRVQGGAPEPASAPEAADDGAGVVDVDRGARPARRARCEDARGFGAVVRAGRRAEPARPGALAPARARAQEARVREAGRAHRARGAVVREAQRVPGLGGQRRCEGSRRESDSYQRHSRRDERGAKPVGGGVATVKSCIP